MFAENADLNALLPGRKRMFPAATEMTSFAGAQQTKVALLRDFGDQG
jgi:hypothetical protein